MNGPSRRRSRRRYQPDWPDFARRRRRLSRSLVAIGALIAVAGVVGAALRASEEPRPRLEELGDAWRFAGGDAEELITVTVDRVIDGDTFDVLSALTAFRVRVFGIDAPERGERCSEQATDRLRELLGAAALLLPDDRLEDASGRQLRYVFAADGRSIDAALVAEGLARAWREDGALRDQLVTIEDAARSAGTGCLWTSG